MNNFKKLIQNFDTEIKNILDSAEPNNQQKILEYLKQLRKDFLGPESTIKLNYQDKIKLFNNDEKKIIGAGISESTKKINAILQKTQALIDESIFLQQISAEQINLENDLCTFLENGGVHPLNHILKQITNFFHKLGYTIINGQEVETTSFNFEHLNIPKNHPARDMHDSFFINEKMLLRTHCTNMTARFLLQANPKNEEMQILSMGNVYRKDEDDATHSHQFMQVDVFNIGPTINLANLKWTLNALIKELFGPKISLRMRPSFFPFTEPSLEVDITCNKCQGQGCNFCKHTGWIEILGAGMIHPNVIKSTGHNSKKIQGFAFGVGIERIALLKYGIDDIRHLYLNDSRFLSQFKF